MHRGKQRKWLMPVQVAVASDRLVFLLGIDERQSKPTGQYHVDHCSLFRVRKARLTM